MQYLSVLINYNTIPFFFPANGLAATPDNNVKLTSMQLHHVTAALIWLRYNDLLSCNKHNNVLI